MHTLLDYDGHLPAYVVSGRKHSNIKYVSFCALAIYF
jgi:hypothetical protein